MLDGKMQIVVEADLSPGKSRPAEIRWTPQEMKGDDVAMMLMFVIYNKMRDANPHKTRSEIAELLSTLLTDICESEDECDMGEAQGATKH